MRPITLLLIFTLIFTSCKNESNTKEINQSRTQTENPKDENTDRDGEYEVIDETVTKLWSDYIASNPEFKDDEIPEYDFFTNDREAADKLAALTVSGKKRATTSSHMLYKRYDIDLPKIGTKKIITDFEGKAQAIIAYEKVEMIPFNKVSKEYAAIDMGTDIEPLKKWREAHWDFFEKLILESKMEPSKDMLMVCVRFKTIWTKND